ncbi:MAG TPA: hypothetical protein PKX44_08790, partial [Methanomassiliicoccaceae archaeon]|nr:hypothetical protein [Methanomassiliicoccaceae archaeon]
MLHVRDQSPRVVPQYVQVPPGDPFLDGIRIVLGLPVLPDQVVDLLLEVRFARRSRSTTWSGSTGRPR